MPTFDDVAALVREYAAVSGPLTETTMLQLELGVYGYEMDDLLGAYSKRFGVDMSGYRWYFHTGAEGTFNIGMLIFPPPNHRVSEIPITVGMLHQFAEKGQWAVNYPPHVLPRYRLDVWINLVVLVSILGLSVVIWFWSCVK